MPITIEFNGSSLTGLAREIENAVEMRSEDVLYALTRQRSRILERTARGVDINNTPFEPYSEKGPYYYYPVKGTSAKSIFPKNGDLEGRARSAAAGRFSKKVGGVKTSVGVKFASYGDFKRSLGRGTVDLTGPRAPHMLQAIVVKTTGQTAGIIGIYGNEADRAEGHNTGAGNNPKREFFGVSIADEIAMTDDVEKIIAARLGKVL